MRSRKRWNRFHITFSFKHIHTGGKWSRSMLANLKQCKHTYTYTDSQAHTYFTDGVCDGQTWLTASPLKKNEAMQKACAAVVCWNWLLVCFEELALKKYLMNCTKKGNGCVHFPEKVDSSTLNSPRFGVNSSTGIDSRCWLCFCFRNCLGSDEDCTG